MFFQCILGKDLKYISKNVHHRLAEYLSSLRLNENVAPKKGILSFSNYKKM